MLAVDAVVDALKAMSKQVTTPEEIAQVGGSYINGLVRERSNSSALAMELRLSVSCIQLASLHKFRIFPISLYIILRKIFPKSCKSIKLQVVLLAEAVR